MTRAPLDRSTHVVRWVVLSSFVGATAGILSAAFIRALDWTTETRQSNLWLIWLLPLAGLVVGSAYHWLGKGLERGSNLLIDQIHEHSEWIPVRMSVLIFVCSVISHVAGASVGREGAALQLAAGATDPISKRLGLDEHDRSIMLITAIAGGFGSIFGVPVTGAVFALEVQKVGRVRYEAIIPAFTASIVGDAVVGALGVQHTHYGILPGFDWSATLAWQFVLLGIAAGLVAMAFVSTTHHVRSMMQKFVSWYPARPLIGGALIAALVLLFDWRDYQGLSTHLALHAFGGSSGGQWVTKPLLTAISVGSGFVGGEVIPMFVTGALLGASAGHILGADVTLFAMVGATAVLAGAANTPLACVFLGIELFGGSGAVLFAVVCTVAYASSGHKGIYHAQPVSAHKSGLRGGG